jgi:FemAB-related protein (PEP-CTERM system-associated)
MTIVACDNSHAEAWDAYATTAPGASYYHRFAWKRINERAFSHQTAFLAAMDGGRITGILPLVRVSSWLFGNIACSMPFVNYGGPVADSPEIERALLAEARRVCDTWKVAYCELRARHHLGDDIPSSQHKVSLTLALDKDPETHWNGFKTGHRQDIRRGHKHGLVARVGGVELLDPFFEVMSESWRNLGTPLYSRHYFRLILDALGESTRLCVIYAGDDPAAAAFDGLHGGTVEGLWMGSKAKYRKLLVTYVLYWELIKDACERGYTRFHFGRSSVDSGGEAFKKKWNASIEPLYWHYLLRTRTEIPSLNVNNPRYQLAIDTWRRLPVPVTRLIGPSIARSIP